MGGLELCAPPLTIPEGGGCGTRFMKHKKGPPQRKAQIGGASSELRLAKQEYFGGAEFHSTECASE